MSYITPKTTRGVQEQDVWAAADAVLAQGQRPTIERVRQQLGRGSPNTVGPMLESWFSRLGERLELHRQGDRAMDALPDAVLESVRALWQTAQQQAHAAAQSALATAHAEMEQAQAVLQQEQERLLRQEESLQQQKQAMEEAWRLAQAQQADLSQRLDAAQLQLQQRDAVIAQLHADVEAVQVQREAERQEHSAHVQAAAQERQRLVEQFAGNEKRWLTELDRSRQELEKTRKQLQEVQATAQARQQTLQAQLTQQDGVLQQERTLHQQAVQALAVAQERQLLLQEQVQRLSLAGEGGGAEGTMAAVRSGPSLQRRALSQRSRRLGRR